jgi:hypothetical protein
MDMTKKPEYQIDFLMTQISPYKKGLSQTAPVPNDTEVKAFVKYLVNMRIPMKFTILRNFVLGVFVPTDEMLEEMTKFIVKVFEEGRLCLVIQETLWNLMSQNFILSYKVYINSLSEVSWEFFKQNIIGRWGRVGQTSSALIRCFTSSGKIVDDKLSVQKFKCQKAQMVSFEQLISPQSRSMSHPFLHRFCGFLNGCFNFDINEVEFILTLKKMSDVAIYNDAFKYCCYGNQYKVFVQLMSCYLVSQLCDLGAADKVKMTQTQLGFMKRIAINEVSWTTFDFLRKAETESNIRESFCDAVCNLAMPDSRHLSTAILLLGPLIENKCPNLPQRLLVRIFFDIRKLMKFVEVVLAFLKNLYFSKTVQDQNPEIRAFVSMIDGVKQTLDFLICLIVSKVNETHFLKEVDDKCSGSVAEPVSQNPLINLCADLQACSPQTIEKYHAILQVFSKSFPTCASVFDSFKNECKSFGPDCLTSSILAELRMNQCSCQAELDTCVQRMKEIETSLNGLTGPPALKARNRLTLSDQMKREVSNHSTSQRTLSEIPSKIVECESLLRTYTGMSEVQFLSKFLSNFLSDFQKKHSD